MPSEQLAGQAQLDLAQTLLDQELYEKAARGISALPRGVLRPAGQPRALMGKGWSLWGLGRYAESATAFEKA